MFTTNTKQRLTVYPSILFDLHTKVGKTLGSSWEIAQQPLVSIRKLQHLIELTSTEKSFIVIYTYSFHQNTCILRYN